MSKTATNDLKKIVNAILFENNINELRLPLDHDMDMFKNNSTGAKNQAGPMINGEGEYKNSWEEERPVSSSDLVNNQSLIRVDINADNVLSKDINPTNVTELSALIQTLLKDVGRNDLSQKEITTVWKLITKIIDK